MMLGHERAHWRGRRPVGALVFLLTLAAAPAVAQDTPPITGNPGSGRRIFQERGCMGCHSIWGNGGTLGPDFATVGAGASLQQLAGMFWNHTPRMIETVRARGIEWPTFTEAEMADIISYVYYVKLFDEPGDPELGARWFLEKRCIVCHEVGGSGGDIGPALDRYARYLAPILLAQGMWNHGQKMREAQSERGIPTPTFVGREVADLQAYIRRASLLRDRNVELLPPPDPNRGRSLFSTKGCVRCHGQGGRGTPFGPNLLMATQRLGVAEIAGQLWNHSAQMEQAMQARGVTFPQFEDTEMADVIAFLYYLRFYDTEGDARKGQVLFAEKGCAKCHARDGTPRLGPDLSMSQAVLTPMGLATAMWDHAPAMYDLIRVRDDVEWPRFEGDEMRDLSVYLRSRAAAARSSGPGRTNR